MFHFCEVCCMVWFVAAHVYVGTHICKSAFQNLKDYICLKWNVYTSNSKSTVLLRYSVVLCFLKDSIFLWDAICEVAFFIHSSQLISVSTASKLHWEMLNVMDYCIWSSNNHPCVCIPLIHTYAIREEYYQIAIEGIDSIRNVSIWLLCNVF